MREWYYRRRSNSHCLRHVFGFPHGGGLVCGPAAAALAAVGATEPNNANSLDFRPAPFASL